MKKLVIGFVAVAIIAGAIWYAPKYLAYADQPFKADCIVLFVGPDWNARKKEAIELMEEEYATHLLIPAYGQVFDTLAVSRFHATTHPCDFTRSRLCAIPCVLVRLPA